MPGETLSLKCVCGYIKHDVMHLGTWQNRDTKLLQYCGGLFELNQTGDGVACKKCSMFTDKVEFFCAFCERVAVIPVCYRVAKNFPTKYFKMAEKTLSLKCSCGYIKHDVMHLGIWKNRWTSLLHYCGGLLEITKDGGGVSCRKCSTVLKSVEFHCTFCDQVSHVSVSYQEAKNEGRVTVVQMSVHQTIVFSSN